MDPSLVKRQLKSLPYMSLEQGRKVFDIICSHRLSRCLELGFYHGVSSAYIAAALDELGSGQLVTIDLEWARTLEPNIGSVLRSLKLSRFVEYHYEPTSYHWRLMKILRDDSDCLFDFCYIDGGHTWSSTGFAFFLVSKLLRPGAWLIFDDLYWTHEDPSVRDTERVKSMPYEEKTSAQVGLVFDLLVRRDRDFTDIMVDGQWGFARKR